MASHKSRLYTVSLLTYDSHGLVVDLEVKLLCPHERKRNAPVLKIYEH
jgi:hypothetical protein